MEMMSESIITIKFARGLLGEEFTAKNGNELVRVKIPNEDPEDHSPWASFVVPVDAVYDSQNGKAICVDLPADEETTVTKSHLKGKDPDGKNLWEDERYKVSNSQLKEMVEFYKKKPRENER